MFDYMDEDYIKPLIDLLRTGVYHATSFDNYRRILTSGQITPRSGYEGMSCDRPHLANCWEMSAVSLFDFELPPLNRIFDRIEFAKWSGLLVRSGATVFIGFRREQLPGHIVYFEEAKQRCGLGGIIPSVEICHEGPIPVALAFQCVVVSATPDISLRIYPGYKIPD